MSWSLDWNGFGTTTTDWSCINILSYTAEPVFARDGITHETTLHTLEGTAVIGNGAPGFMANLKKAKSYLTRQCVEFKLTDGTDALFEWVADQDTHATATIDGPPDELLHTPIGQFSIERIFGSVSALVRFRIQWHNYEVISSDVAGEDYHVMSHWWVPRWTTDESGLQTYTVNGEIRVRQDVTLETDPPSNMALSGPHPDRYRYLVMPQIPASFRVTALDFAIDETATRLSYRMTAEQAMRALPAPAKRGTGTYRWTRALGIGGGPLGKKVFVGELEGVGDEATIPTLVSSMVQVSANRINWALTNGDMIQSMEITERDVFKRMKIGFRVEALAATREADPIAPFGISDPHWMTNLIEGLEPAESPDPYGSKLLRVVKRQLFKPASGYNEETFPFAQVESHEPVYENTYEVPSTAYPNAEESGLGDDPFPDGIVEDHQENPYLEVRVRERMTTKTYMAAVPSRALNARDLVFQTRPPEVWVESEIQVLRVGKAPDPVALLPPPASLIEHEEWSSTPGQLDGQNRRVVGAIYRRRVKLLQTGFAGGGGGGGPPTQPPEGKGQQVVYFHPQPLGDYNYLQFLIPTGFMALPFDPRSETRLSGRTRNLFQSNFSAAEGLSLDIESSTDPYFTGT